MTPCGVSFACVRTYSSLQVLPEHGFLPDAFARHGPHAALFQVRDVMDGRPAVPGLLIVNTGEKGVVPAEGGAVLLPLRPAVIRLGKGLQPVRPREGDAGRFLSVRRVQHGQVIRPGEKLL